MRFPGPVDVHLNLGWKHGEQYMPGATHISIRQIRPASRAPHRSNLGIVADLKLAMADLIDAVEQSCDPSPAEEHRRQAQQARERVQLAAGEVDPENRNRNHAGSSEITMERTRRRTRTGAREGHYLRLRRRFRKKHGSIHVVAAVTIRNMSPPGPLCFGWGIAAGLGARLARAGPAVVSVVGDGSFLFGGPQPLWSPCALPRSEYGDRASTTRATTMSEIASG